MEQVPLASPVLVDGGAVDVQLRPTYTPEAVSTTDPAFISSLIMSLIGLALVISSIAITIASRRR